MKIVAVTSRFPYPIERGDKLRAHYQLRELARHHEVVLVALAEGEVDRGARGVIDDMGIRSHVVSRTRVSTVMSTGVGVLTGRPVQVGYFAAPGTRREVRRIIEDEQPDHLYCQLLRTAWAVDGVSVDATIDYQDAFAAAMRRRAGQHNAVLRRVFEFEADRIGAAEAEAFGAFGRRVVISEQDRDHLEVPDPLGVAVLPNGVDTSVFARRDPDAPTDVDVAFVGNMGYPPNVRAAHMLVKEVMPQVWARRPSAKVLLAGARPTRSVRALADSRVEVSGWVDDVRDAYRRTRLMVAPLFIGAGQQNKVLESMAMGVPCVTTQLVNNAIGAEPDRQIVLAGGGDEFASRIVDLLDSPDKCRDISDEAWEFVLAGFSWSSVGDRLSAIVESP